MDFIFNDLTGVLGILAQLELDASVELSGDEPIGHNHHHSRDEEQDEEQQHIPEKKIIIHKEEKERGVRSEGGGLHELNVGM